MNTVHKVLSAMLPNVSRLRIREDNAVDRRLDTSSPLLLFSSILQGLTGLSLSTKPALRNASGWFEPTNLFRDPPAGIDKIYPYSVEWLLDYCAVRNVELPGDTEPGIEIEIPTLPKTFVLPSGYAGFVERLYGWEDDMISRLRKTLTADVLDEDTREDLMYGISEEDHKIRESILDGMSPEYGAMFSFVKSAIKDAFPPELRATDDVQAMPLITRLDDRDSELVPEFHDDGFNFLNVIVELGSDKDGDLRKGTMYKEESTGKIYQAAYRNAGQVSVGIGFGNVVDHAVPTTTIYDQERVAVRFACRLQPTIAPEEVNTGIRALTTALATAQRSN